jgi:hypothetical protein
MTTFLTTMQDDDASYLRGGTLGDALGVIR